MESSVQCAMDGNKFIIILMSIEQSNAQLQTVKRDNARTIT